MSQDHTAKHAYEAAAKQGKEARDEAQADTEFNAAVLSADNHTGQQGMLPLGGELIAAADVKAVYPLLPDWHRDELRRLFVVSPGTRLTMGDVFCDLRFRERGELTAHGEEEVHEELLVPKSAVDYQIWNKLLGKPSSANLHRQARSAEGKSEHEVKSEQRGKISVFPRREGRFFIRLSSSPALMSLMSSVSAVKLCSRLSRPVSSE